MAVCGGSRCSKRDKCKNYEGNFFKCHETSGVEQYIDWSQHGFGSISIDADGNIYCDNHHECGDLSDGYPMFQELQYNKPVNLQEVKEFIYNSLKRRYGNYVVSERDNDDIVIDTKTNYLGNSDVWISLEYFH